MRTWLAIGLAVLGSGCYDPKWSVNVDANMALRCYPTDTPACPSGLSCCKTSASGTYCGDDLQNNNNDFPADNDGKRGYCVPPVAPPDLAMMPTDYWDFGVKQMPVWATLDPMLTGKDCPYSAPGENEPNDLPEQALTTTLTLDDTTKPYKTWNICHDGTVPGWDVDAIKVRVNPNGPTKLVVDVKYQMARGDIDVALFREDIDDKGRRRQNLYLNDLTSTDNACITANNVQAGTYYVVFRGAPDKAGPYNKASNYALNTYQFRVLLLNQNSATGCTSMNKDGGT